MRNEFVALLQDMAFITNEIVHLRFRPEPDVVLPPVRKVVQERSAASCAKADLSAGAILEFLGTQEKQSGVFDGYLVTGLKKEVKADG